MNPPEIDLALLQKTATVNRQVINRLKERVSILENALTLVCDDPQMAWLFRNRSERMDATLPLFPAGRAAFHLARYEFASQHVSQKTVADIACGTGYGTRLLAEKGGAKKVFGVDICEPAIEYARTRHLADGCVYQVSDATATGMADASIDVVVSFETLEHIPDDVALLHEFARILKPGGTLICSTPNGWPLEIAPHHVSVYDRRSFTEKLSACFAPVELWNQNSGTDFRYNHGQPAGMVPTTDENCESAECFIAVATKS